MGVWKIQTGLTLVAGGSSQSGSFRSWHERVNDLQLEVIQTCQYHRLTWFTYLFRTPLQYGAISLSTHPCLNY